MGIRESLGMGIRNRLCVGEVGKAVAKGACRALASALPGRKLCVRSCARLVCRLLRRRRLRVGVRLPAKPALSYGRRAAWIVAEHFVGSSDQNQRELPQGSTVLPGQQRSPGALGGRRAFQRLRFEVGP
jgi:hypothetical protein